VTFYSIWTIQVSVGEVLAALRNMPDVFDKGSLLVSVSAGKERVIQEISALTFYLASYFQF